MTDVVKFTVPGRPVAWHRPRWNSETRTVFNDRATESWRGKIITAAKAAMIGHKVMTGKIMLSVAAFFAMPKSWPKYRVREHLQRRELYPSSPDLDNVFKAIKDSCEAVVFENDRLICAYGLSGKFYTRPGEVERVEIIIEEFEPLVRVALPRKAAGDLFAPSLELPPPVLAIPAPSSDVAVAHSKRSDPVMAAFREAVEREAAR